MPNFKYTASLSGPSFSFYAWDKNKSLQNWWEPQADHFKNKAQFQAETGRIMLIILSSAAECERLIKTLETYDNNDVANREETIAQLNAAKVVFEKSGPDAVSILYDANLAKTKAGIETINQEIVTPTVNEYSRLKDAKIYTVESKKPNEEKIDYDSIRENGGWRNML